MSNMPTDVSNSGQLVQELQAGITHAQVTDVGLAFKPAQKTSVTVRITNSGDVPWTGHGSAAVLLSYHWLDMSGTVLVWDGLRTPLSCHLHPGETVTMQMDVLAPESPGTYKLAVDLVQEGHLWFADISPAGRDETLVFVHPYSDTVLAGQGDLIRWETEHLLFSDLEELDLEIIRKVRPYTMTTPARIAALLAATRHIISSEVPGAFVECGVWKGGSSMAMAMQLQTLGAKDRKLFLFDTFAGMSPPTVFDRNLWDESASERFAVLGGSPTGSDWANSSLNEVSENLSRIGLHKSSYSLIQGLVEDTIPEFAPDQIALLRLDTDWYESTRHELEHLIPRMAKGGVVIVDDYGHWKGSKKAVDEYFTAKKMQPFLHRIDYAARLWIVG